MKLIIKELRLRNNLTQDDVVRLTGIKKRSYIDYEQNKTDIPVSKLQKIATAFGVKIEDFLIHEDESENHEEYFTAPVIEYKKVNNDSISTPLVHRYVPNTFDYDNALESLPVVVWTAKPYYINFKQDDFLSFEMVGDAMTSTSSKSIIDGDILLGLRSEKIETGKVYAFIYNNHPIIAMVKKVLKEHIQCTYLNTFYDSDKLSTNEIKAQYKIIELNREHAF